jgi:hypothetical protein
MAERCRVQPRTPLSPPQPELREPDTVSRAQASLLVNLERSRWELALNRVARMTPQDRERWAARKRRALDKAERLAGE